MVERHYREKPPLIPDELVGCIGPLIGILIGGVLVFGALFHLYDWLRT